MRLDWTMISDLQRAFELADSGACRTVEGIWARLMAEGFSTRFSQSPWVREQLQRALQSVTAKRAAA
jgi:hypothetical protein